MKKFASIDIGTNTIRLLIAECINGEIIDIEDRLLNTRLGENSLEDNILKPEPIKRTIDGLKEFFKIINENSIDRNKIIITATSCVRDAMNREYFTKIIKDNFNFDIRVLKGDEEALIVANGISRIHNSIIVDIGGGSTEIIIITNDKIEFLTSLNIGAVRLTEKCLFNDPYTKDEIHNCINKINEILKDTFDTLTKDHNLNELCKTHKIFGVGGTITTLAAIDMKMYDYDSASINNSDLRLNTIDSILETLLNSNQSQRENIVGLEQKRADIISSGVLILKEILNQFNFNNITVSTKGIREGSIRLLEKEIN